MYEKEEHEGNEENNVCIGLEAFTLNPEVIDPYATVG